MPLRALVLALCAALGGCYALQAVHGQFEILGARQPIAKVRADPATDARTAHALDVATEARDLARAALGLPAGGSFRSFVRLPREWPVWNVIVAPPLAVEPRPQCFVLVGCLAYRGFFAEADARAWADKARARGDDVLVAPVPAYSTLGWFDDPLLWSMLRWDDATLAATVSHETAHEAVYSGDDTGFDEAFAEAVSDALVERMFATPEREAKLAAWHRAHERQARRDALLLAARADLAVLYRGPFDDAAKLAAKAARLERLRAELGAMDPAWAEQRWDNARLALTATYSELVPGFAALLAEEGGDIGRFRATVAALAKRPPAERRTALRAAAARAARPAAD